MHYFKAVQLLMISNTYAFTNLLYLNDIQRDIILTRGIIVRFVLFGLCNKQLFTNYIIKYLVHHLRCVMWYVFVNFHSLF